MLRSNFAPHAGGSRHDMRAHSAIIMSFTDYAAARLRRVTEITSLACGNIILIMKATVSNCESNALFMPLFRATHRRGMGIRKLAELSPGNRSKFENS